MQAADALADAQTIHEVCTMLRPELMKALGMLEGMEAPKPHQLPPTPRILHPSQRPRSKTFLRPLLCCITPAGLPPLPTPNGVGKGGVGATPSLMATPGNIAADGSRPLGRHITRATALQVCHPPLQLLLHALR